MGYAVGVLSEKVAQQVIDYEAGYHCGVFDAKKSVEERDF